MPEPRRVLIVGGSQIGGLFGAVERRGLEAVVLGLREVLDRFPLPAGVRHAEVLDPTQPLPVLVRRIETLGRAHDVAGLVPIMEYALLPAAMATERLGRPGPGTKAVLNTRDKLRMRRVLEAAGLGQVRHAACRTLDEARRFREEVGGPIFVKPVLGTASDGVSRVDGEQDLEAAFAVAARARAFGGVLCEEFLEGPEVSVEGYSVSGVFLPVAITDKIIDHRFLEVGHSQPSGHPEEDQRAAATLTGRVLEALGVRDGVSHTEVKLTPRGPVLVETHTRMAGGNIHRLTERTTGVDLADLMVAFALGERPEARPQPTGRGASIRFLVGRPGRIAAAVVPPPPPEIEEARIYLEAGETVGERSSSLDRLGHVLAVAESGPAATAAAEAFRDRIRVRYEGEAASLDERVA